MDREVFQRVYPDEFGRAHLASGVRIDGRRFGDARKVRCTVGSLGGSVIGSAMVKLGSTTVIGGVSAVCTKKGESSGSLVVELEVLQMACEGARHVRDRESIAAPVLSYVAGVLSNGRSAPSLDEMCAATSMPPANLAWEVTLRLYVVDLDGNLLDTALLAATAALANAKLPVVELETMTVTSKDNLLAVPLPWRDPPVSISFAVVERPDNEPPLLLIDPIKQEEELASNARITVLISSSSGDVLAVDKIGGDPIDASALEEAVRLAKARAPLLQKVLQKFSS